MIRLSGLASGMDTESLIQKLMKAEKVPVDRLKQQQQKLMWKSDAFREWNSELFTYRSKTLFDMKMSKTYDTFDVASTRTEAVTGTATAEAMAGTYDLTVHQIAKSASFTSNHVQLDTTKTMGDVVQGKHQLTTDSTFSVIVFNNPDNPTSFNTADITIRTTDTIYDVLGQFNNAKDATGKSLGLQAAYDSNLKQFIIKTKSTGAATKIEFGSDSEFLHKALGIGSTSAVTGDAVTYPVAVDSLTQNNHQLSIDLGNGVSSTLTLADGTYSTAADLVNALNSAISGNATLQNKVTASTDLSGKIIFTSMAGSSPSTITVSGNADLGFGGAGKTDTVSGTLTTSGQNASVTLNGTTVNNISSNNVTLLGVNYTWKSQTLDSNGNPVSSTITVTRNVEKELENIKGFIEKYNELLEKLNSEIDEPVYKSYQPLSDEEKEALSEKQIEKWEEKAKSGLLRRDDILSDLTVKMRNLMSTTVDNGSDYKSLSSIGIKSMSYKDKGKLYIDEDKLRDALQKDPDGVKKLLTQSGDSTDKNGLVNRLYDEFSEAIKKLTDKAGASGSTQYDQSLIGKLLSNTQKDITRAEDLLTRRENNYYRQFTAMEKAMSSYNSQAAWLMQQLGGN